MHNYFQKSNPIEKQIKELFDLNIKTMQNFRMFNPTELLHTRNPEQFFEKNMELLIQNGHKTLDYMENIFNILENNWMNMSQDVLKNVQKTGFESERFSNIFDEQKKAGSAAVKDTPLEKKKPKRAKSASRLAASKSPSRKASSKVARPTIKAASSASQKIGSRKPSSKHSKKTVSSRRVANRFAA